MRIDPVACPVQGQGMTSPPGMGRGGTFCLAAVLGLPKDKRLPAQTSAVKFLTKIDRVVQIDCVALVVLAKSFRIMFSPFEVFYAFRSREGGHLDFDSRLIPEICAIFIQFCSLFERRFFAALTY
jgi:hypothetical protein